MLRGYRSACTHSHEWIHTERIHTETCRGTLPLMRIHTDITRACYRHTCAQQTCCTHTLIDAHSQTSVLTLYTDTQTQVLRTHGVSTCTQGCTHMHTQGGMCSKKGPWHRGHEFWLVCFLGREEIWEESPGGDEWAEHWKAGRNLLGWYKGEKRSPSRRSGSCKVPEKWKFVADSCWRMAETISIL